MVKRNGFTLVELLVVIAIISILAAMLLPVLSTAKETAYLSSCGSNLKQSGLLQVQYCDEYDEYYPDINNQANGLWKIAKGRKIDANCWTEVLGGLYLDYPTKYNDWGAGRHGLFHCPSAPKAYPGRSFDYGVDYNTTNRIIPRTAWNTAVPNKPIPVSRAQVTRPVILASDSTSPVISFPWGTTYQDVTPRHMGEMMKANFLFTDNHVESDSSYYLKYSSTYSYPWYWE